VPFLPIYFMFFLPPSGTEWIYSWMQYVPYMIVLVYAFVCVLVPYIAKKKKKEGDDKPTQEQAAKPRKLFFLILALALIPVIAVAMLAYALFASNTFEKADRYLKSPDGRHKAVVMSREYSDTWVDEEIYPVKSLLFYEDRNGVDISPKSYHITITWLDDSTLEITRTNKRTGEVSTDYLRW